MLSKVIKILLFLLLLFITENSVFAASRKQVLCLNPQGELLARKKCLSDESIFNIALLTQQISQSVGGTSVGPKGPTGNKGVTGEAGTKGIKGLIDFSACRLIGGYDTNFWNTTNGALSTVLTCDPNTEFLYDEDYVISTFPGSEGTTAYMQSNDPTNFTIVGDTRIHEVSIYINRDKIVGAGAYQINTRAICCPR